MEHSDSIANLTAALVKVQAQLKPLKRNAENPFFKSSYTDLAAFSETVLPLLAANGLALIQGADGHTLDTMLAHISGEWVRSSLPLPVEPNPQKMGTILTYFRRYSGAAMVMAVSEGEDDDGNAASHPPARPSAPAPSNRPPAETGARQPTPPAPAAPAGGSPALHVQFLDQATGEKAGKPWTRFTAKFDNGVKCSTFDTRFGEVLAEAKAKALPVHVKTEQKGQFTNLVYVALAGAEPEPTDADMGVPF